MKLNMRILISIVLVCCFICSYGQIGSEKNESSEQTSKVYEQLLELDSIINQFYDSLMLFVREDVLNAILDKDPCFQNTLPYFIDSVCLKVFFCSGDSLSLIDYGEETNICSNLIDRKKNRIKNLKFLGQVDELNRIPYELIKHYQLQFNLVLYDEVFIRTNYILSINQRDFKTVEKRIEFPSNEPTINLK